MKMQEAIENLEKTIDIMRVQLAVMEAALETLKKINFKALDAFMDKTTTSEDDERN